MALARLGADHGADAESILVAAMAGRHQVRMGQAHDVLALPGMGAFVDGRLAGLATWAPGPERFELAVLAVSAAQRGMGLGGALVEATVDVARRAGATSVWLVTTNDNLDALRLYQRHRFRLVELRAGAVDRTRAVVMPGIPTLGNYGIPLRDELVLERAL